MREKDSQVVSIFTLSGSTSVKAERKCVGEIDTRCNVNKVIHFYFILIICYFIVAVSAIN